MPRCAWSSLLCCLALVVGATGCVAIDRPYEPLGNAPGWDSVGSCSSCGTCPGDSQGHTPVSYVARQLTCAGGCGELYWGEWLSDPPQRCDPCDNWGNWIGPQPSGPPLWQRVAGGWIGFWGYRTPSHAGGCTTCGPDGEDVFAPALDAEIVEPPVVEASQQARRPAAGRQPVPPPRLFHSVRFSR
jgi:hypothetical protein